MIVTIYDIKNSDTMKKAFAWLDARRIAYDFDYIERFYNPKRRHSTIGYLTPMDYEMRAGLP